MTTVKNGCWAASGADFFNLKSISIIYGFFFDIVIKYLFNSLEFLSN